MVWNLHTGFVNPQYHAVFDDKFDTIFNNGTTDENFDAIYNDLLEIVRTGTLSVGTLQDGSLSLSLSCAYTRDPSKSR